MKLSFDHNAFLLDPKRGEENQHARRIEANDAFFLTFSLGELRQTTLLPQSEQPRTEDSAFEDLRSKLGAYMPSFC